MIFSLRLLEKQGEYKALLRYERDLGEYLLQLGDVSSEWGKWDASVGLFRFLGLFTTRQRQCQENSTAQGHLWPLAQSAFPRERMHSAFGISVHLVMHQKESWGNNLCHDCSRRCMVG